MYVKHISLQLLLSTYMVDVLGYYLSYQVYPSVHHIQILDFISKQIYRDFHIHCIINEANIFSWTSSSFKNIRYDEAWLQSQDSNLRNIVIRCQLSLFILARILWIRMFINAPRSSFFDMLAPLALIKTNTYSAL